MPRTAKQERNVLERSQTRSYEWTVAQLSSICTFYKNVWLPCLCPPSSEEGVTPLSVPFSFVGKLSPHRNDHRKVDQSNIRCHFYSSLELSSWVYHYNIVLQEKESLDGAFIDPFSTTLRGTVV